MVSLSQSSPVVLLSATLRWPIAARLAMAFTGLGCRVDVLCPAQHPASATRAVRRTHPHSIWMPLHSLRAAIEATTPDLVIPCDDDAAVQLHRLYAALDDTQASTTRLRALIERSLGSPAACTLATTRGPLMALAADEGLRIPHTLRVDTPAELNGWLRQACLPAVIKIDNTWGGQGVAIVRTHNEARHAFAVMAARPGITNAVVRVLLDRDLSVLRSAWGNARRTVSVQAFVQGAAANRAVACWQGKVLAGISVEAINTQHATGPATVVRVIHNAEMTEAVERLVRRLGVSGLWGVDFVLDAATGAATLIEMNPRATPICHLSLGVGQDLPAALHAQLLGQAPAHAAAAIHGETIALFPGEWRRDPTSVHLHSGCHDVPWHEPELVLDGIRRPWSERGVVARLWRCLHPRSRGQPSLVDARAPATRVDSAKDPSLLRRAP